MQPGDAVAAGVIFDRRNEAARDTLPPECRIDIEAGQPWRKIMGRLELVQHQKTDAGEPAVEMSDKGGLRTLWFDREFGELVFAVGNGKPIVLEKGLMAPAGGDRKFLGMRLEAAGWSPVAGP